MKYLFLIKTLLFLMLFLVSCSPDLEKDQYNVYIYDENLVHFTPPQEYIEEFEALIRSEYIKHISYRQTLPDDHEESPVIIVTRSAGMIGPFELETNYYEVLFDFFIGLNE
ncbi:hypothetical protein QA612_00815 [Evansella sp. AB-P1]|uniref:hypothetical protein n=1 Tax=Evansella sp. AB-P1 TaxID=3037653 RepID=UPI00241F5A17|nr:hypothetical protein [Evansella sp. AB-P1]MDG5786011.1 hypothetical protein [Evansella sp. AB-P1]